MYYHLSIVFLFSCFHAVADAVGGVVPAQSTEHSCGAGVDDNSYPFDRLHAWIIKILNTVANMHLDADWLRKGKLKMLMGMAEQD